MAATAIDLQNYASLNGGDRTKRILEASAAPGERVVMPGHSYRRDEIPGHADFCGDSSRLSRRMLDI